MKYSEYDDIIIPERFLKGDIQVKEYIHSKMGRSDIHSMGVNELIISYKRQ